MNFQYLIFLGAIVQFVGIYGYIRDTVRGKTKPNRVSWLLWFVSASIASVAAISDGVRWAVLPVFLSGFCPLLVFIASFVNKNSYWQLEKFDYLCGLFSIIALILWGITKEPNVAIVFSIISDGLAATPTIIKSWKFPETETVDAYAVGLFAAITGFFAIEQWTFASYAFPLYLVTVNSLLIVLITKGKHFKIVRT